MQRTATAPPPTDPIGTWEGSYPGTADQLRRVRAELRPLLHGCSAAEDVITLVNELCANAILHSDSRRPGGGFTVRLQHIHGHYIRAEVQDQGSAWDGDLTRSARRPHGLYLLLALSHRCGVEHGARSGTAWFCIDCLPCPAGHLTAGHFPAPSPTGVSAETPRCHSA